MLKESTSVERQHSGVLILGASGYLGQRFVAAYPGAASSSIDIANPSAVAHLLALVQPHMVINCAGRTGKPNVDWCEDHREETLRSNVTGPLVLLDECRRHNIYLVHLSSGCIYEGDDEEFTEEDLPNFTGSFYARTKAWTDQVFKEFPVLTLRLRMPFDGSGSPRCLLTKLSGYRRVLVQKNSLTHLPGFLSAARVLIGRRATGVYNIVNEGAMSPYQIMELYRDLVDSGHTFEPLQPGQLGEVTRAGRSNCRLSSEKLKREGLALPPVRQAVETALGRLAGTRRAGAGGQVLGRVNLEKPRFGLARPSPPASLPLGTNANDPGEWPRLYLCWQDESLNLAVHVVEQDTREVIAYVKGRDLALFGCTVSVALQSTTEHRLRGMSILLDTPERDDAGTVIGCRGKASLGQLDNIVRDLGNNLAVTAFLAW